MPNKGSNSGSRSSHGTGSGTGSGKGSGSGSGSGQGAASSLALFVQVPDNDRVAVAIGQRMQQSTVSLAINNVTIVDGQVTNHVISQGKGAVTIVRDVNHSQAAAFDLLGSTAQNTFDISAKDINTGSNLTIVDVDGKAVQNFPAPAATIFTVNVNLQ